MEKNDHNDNTESISRGPCGEDDARRHPFESITSGMVPIFSYFFRPVQHGLQTGGAGRNVCGLKCVGRVGVWWVISDKYGIA